MKRQVMYLVFSGAIVRRAAITASVVGPVIAVINHGERICSGLMAQGDWIRVGISFLVPYLVSTISSLLAINASADTQNRQPMSLGAQPSAPLTDIKEM